ncbi:hypothetical protein [Fretibacter rubidus]|uniref:hypothetical protein n=1 Tax=Fretibacter rubidus TaxID=570162 RepID=UPI003529EBFF
MHKNAIDEFLSDYTTPVDDGGFTALIMAKADAEVARIARLRRRIINGAFFIGGLTAAVQMPKLWGLLAGLNLPTVSLPNITLPNITFVDAYMLDAGVISSNISYTVVASLVVAAFTLWILAADQLG